jgi:hypothetical protein
MMNEYLNLPLLLTGVDGLAHWQEKPFPLSEGNPSARLSRVLPATALQWRQSPVGFRSDFHVTTTPQWLIVLQGIMEIGLQNGSWRAFHAGQGFYSGDLLPAGAVFNAALHGHCSRQVGDMPLITCFIRANSFD